MEEKSQTTTTSTPTTTTTTTNQQNDGRKIRKSPESQSAQNTAAQNVVPASVTRERSFVRTSNQQNKRRSLAFNVQGGVNPQAQMRGKPAIDIYRPPNVRKDGGGAMNKLNVHAQEFTMTTNSRSTPPGDGISPRSSVIFPAGSQMLSPGGKAAAAASNLHQHIQYVAAQNAMANHHRRQAGLSVGNMPTTMAGSINHPKGHHHISHRPGVVPPHPSHPMQLNHINQQMPLINSPSSGNVLHQNRVKFAVGPSPVYKTYHNQMVQMNNNVNNHQQNVHFADQYAGGNNVDIYKSMAVSPLQRSKSLSSADALTRGIAGLGLGLGNEVTDIGSFSPEVQTLVDTALENPNKLSSRCLMELTTHFISRAVEGRRYALPISRLCLNIIAKEQKETFLEALLNTCRQWYQEREKILFTMQGMKSPSRVRFTAFMAFLTEMFCQLKRRQLQLRSQCEGTTPPLVLLTLLSKCCEDCVKPPVRSLSEIECLFYVLTCIGQDMEMQLPEQLEILLSMVRDAFLNANDSAPAIRRTLLQLIELQASHWQLPGNTVLYYYPSNK